ncbi:MAG: glutamate synthase large chain, partial [Acidimicrobiia bacterium]|nr:glutamate synthase large chain [Acidimicrobiia bacterium]
MQRIPPAQGLYDPAFEHDACGVSFVVDLHGRPSHRIVEMGFTALCNLDHRGAKGAEVNTGDGAGILLQLPDKFLRATVDFELPPLGAYAVGLAFLPSDPAAAEEALAEVETIVAKEGLVTLGWRDVPTDPSSLGSMAIAVMPTFRQLFIAGPAADVESLTGLDLDRRAYCVRKRIEHEIAIPDQDGIDQGVYFASLSSRTLIYKGMLTTPQLPDFFPDILDPRMESALALVHSRFSTNTFPSWPLAHPYRFIAHNGEINTVMGNRNWMRAREELIATDALPGDLERVYPICTPGGSDTASFDEALELLHLGGYPLHHAVLMMIPEAWENHESMSEAKKAFYRFHGALMEPWDGPASIAFTDGSVIGAVLDRNGLRPSRYWVTSDDLVIMASESGVLAHAVPPETVVRKGRLEPGKMFLVDTAQGRMIPDEEIKATLAAEQPYGEWLERATLAFDDLPQSGMVPMSTPDEGTLLTRQQEFGYTLEDLGILIEPMATNGAEAIGSMGTDTPIAVLSTRGRLLYDYFSQLFAQVTNPPLDAIREELVTSLRTRLGPAGNVFAPGPDSVRQLELPSPILTNAQLARLRAAHDGGDFPELSSRTLSAVFPVAEGGAGLRAALDRLVAEVDQAVDEGVQILIVSDRGADRQLAPIPSLLATGAVHHHLIRTRQRFKVGLVVESGEAREVHHFCLLIGYGAGAVNPWLALDTVVDLQAQGVLPVADAATAEKNYVKAGGKGILKVMSKMGISTVASYTGAQVFEAVGLGRELVDEYFTGTTSRVGGIGLEELAREVATRHAIAHPANPLHLAHRTLASGGEYQWRREGEYHLFNPETVFKLQHATRAKRYDIFKEYTHLVDEQSRRLATLRGLFSFRDGEQAPIPLEEVEPVSTIVNR